MPLLAVALDKLDATFARCLKPTVVAALLKYAKYLLFHSQETM